MVNILRITRKKMFSTTLFVKKYKWLFIEIDLIIILTALCITLFIYILKYCERLICTIYCIANYYSSFLFTVRL